VARLRLIALLEVLVCSGFPSQLAIQAALAVAGIPAYDAKGALSPHYVFTLSLADAIVVVGLAAFFIRSGGDRFWRVMLGNRAVAPEMLRGVLYVPVVFLIVAAVMLGLHALAPWLHNVATNPLEGLIRTPVDAVLFTIVAVVGGGIREEVQRAFILHRFERYLGGGRVGLVISSLAFGLGHLVQGRDVAVTTAALGAFWGWIYLRRRSVAATVVSHSGFNAAEILRYTLYGA
jgi:uncharacterized protein